jgi:predicted TIM-barrel fold metal-dependent hydrolase
MLIDAHTHVGSDLFVYLRGHFPYALDWPTLVEQGERFGIGKFVVFPMVSHLGLNLAESRSGRITTKGAWEMIPYAFENRRFMTEITHLFPQYADRAFPLWMLDPSREPQGQCDALRALNEEFPCSGLKIQATVIQSFIRDLLGSGECLMDLAEEKNWPIEIHTSVHPEDPWSAVADILEVARARPGVRFDLAHSCRFDRAALDEIATLPNAWFDCSAHVIHCRLAAQDHPAVAESSRRFVSDFSNPAVVLADLAEKYPNKLLWGSDAPGYSFCDDTMQMFSSYGEEAQTLFQLKQSVIQRIASANILAFLGRDPSE